MPDPITHAEAVSRAENLRRLLREPCDANDRMTARAHAAFLAAYLAQPAPEPVATCMRCGRVGTRYEARQCIGVHTCEYPPSRVDVAGIREQLFEAHDAMMTALRSINPGVPNCECEQCATYRATLPTADDVLGILSDAERAR